MKILERRSLALVFSVALVGTAFWATSAVNAGSSELLSKAAGEIAECYVCHMYHDVEFANLGTLRETPLPGAETNKLLVEVGEESISKSRRRTVSLYIRSIGGRGFVEGVGETRFWLDPTRPAASALWEQIPGRRFPAVQEMRFHFFYTTEAFPGKIFRSINLAVMRSDKVLSFPLPPNTRFRLVAPVELEDISSPGVVVGRVVANEAVVLQNKPSARVLESEGR